MSYFIKQFMPTLLFISLWLVGGAVASTAPPSTGEVLSFKTWKAKQVIRAQNKVARLTNIILLKRSDRYQPAGGEDTPDQDAGAGFTKSAMELSDVRLSLSQAKQDLQIAEELGFEDYLSVYLTQLNGDSEKVKALASKLSTDEVTQTLLYLQRYKKRTAKSTRPRQP